MKIPCEHFATPKMISSESEYKGITYELFWQLEPDGVEVVDRFDCIGIGGNRVSRKHVEIYVGTYNVSSRLNRVQSTQ